MTDNIISFDFNGVKILKDSNTRLVRLSIPAGTNSNVTAHDSIDDSNYQVPAGKKATIIYIETHDRGATGVVNLSYTDDADGNTNAVELFNPNTADSITNLIFVSAEIPAQKYVGAVYTSGSAWDADVIFYAVEESAT